MAGKKDFVWNSVASVKIIKDTMEAHHKGESRLRDSERLFG